ncbi:ABC transporter permease [Chelatococcus sambhunathii]|uniref:ABC transporter permease n=1 Tax=Chelatococcus sambhunathii TaxID=363953 RepID=A0ABU1DGM7_9HYPH|nr:ABC transporter permease [Chelatococcus sambhunathii]MDR4307206.1 ABC transporter permease [Chelatococcus sambhunathii]
MPSPEPVKTPTLSLVAPADAATAAATPLVTMSKPPAAETSQPVAPVKPKMRPLLERVTRDQVVAALLGCASILTLFVVWYLGTKYRLEFYIRFKNVPTPYEVFQQAVDVGLSSAFLTNVLYSVKRILLGFFIAIGIGVPLGLAIGRYKRVANLFMPVIEILRPIPAIAWVPMSIMLWPNNEASIVYITFIGAFFPILLNTVHGVHALDGVLIRAGRVLGASELQLFRHVILPGAMPSIFTGLAVGMGVAWVSLIAAEMISGQFGVGYFTWEAYSLVNYPAIVLGMITIGVLGLVCSGAIRIAGKLLMPWLAFAPGSKK